MADDASISLSADEEALLESEMLPEEFAPPPLDSGLQLEFERLQQEDDVIRQRMEKAMASMAADRSELRAMLGDQQNGGDGDDFSGEGGKSDFDEPDAGRASRQKEIDRLLKEAEADLANWQPSLEELCGPVQSAPKNDISAGDSVFAFTAVDDLSDPTQQQQQQQQQQLSPQRDSSSSLGPTQPAEDSARPHEQAAEKEERREAELARDKLLADLTMREEARRKMIESLQSGSDSVGSGMAGSSDSNSGDRSSRRSCVGGSLSSSSSSSSKGQQPPPQQRQQSSSTTCLTRLPRQITSPQNFNILEQLGATAPARGIDHRRQQLNSSGSSSSAACHEIANGARLANSFPARPRTGSRPPSATGSSSGLCINPGCGVLRATMRPDSPGALATVTTVNGGSRPGSSHKTLPMFSERDATAQSNRAVAAVVASRTLRHSSAKEARAKAVSR